jgi:hypothetical protein
MMVVKSINVVMEVSSRVVLAASSALRLNPQSLSLSPSTVWL